MNLLIRLFEDSLIDLCNKTDIPIEAKRLALRDVLSLIEKKAEEIIREELKEKQSDE